MAFFIPLYKELFLLFNHFVQIKIAANGRAIKNYNTPQILNNNQLSFIEDSISENKIDNIYNTRETKEYFVKRELAIKEQEKWCNGRVNPKPLEEFYSSCNQISKVVATPTVSYGKK